MWMPKGMGEKLSCYCSSFCSLLNVVGCYVLEKSMPLSNKRVDWAGEGEKL